MPSNVNTLLIAWATSLIIVVGGVLLMEAVHTAVPTIPEVKTEHSPANAQPAEPTRTEEQAHATQYDNTGMATAPDTQTTAPAEAEYAVHDEQPVVGMPAPGQPIDENADVLMVSGENHIIPAVALAELLENNTIGLLPKIAEDGRKPMDVYAAARPKDKEKPRIALLVTDLGLKAQLTKNALDELPSVVSLAFSPYGSTLNTWGEQARRTGHEVFITIPMEPENYPQNDPGNLVLLTTQTSRESIQMLRKSLSAMTGYVGVVNYMGSRFTAASESMRPVLDELKLRGLMFVDSRSTPYSRGATMAQAIGVPVAINNGYLDENLSQDQIAEQLDKLEKRAVTQGSAMGIGRPYPVTVESIKRWASGLEARGIILVPVTAVANRQAIPR